MFCSSHIGNFHLALVILWRRVCRCPDVPDSRLTSCPKDTLSVMFFFKYLPHLTVFLFSFSNYLKVIGLGNLFPRGIFLVYSFKADLRYNISYSNWKKKIKITALNLGAMLLISRTSSSLFSAELKPKDCRHHEPNLPWLWEYPVILFFLIFVLNTARHHRGFKGV